MSKLNHVEQNSRSGISGYLKEKWKHLASAALGIGALGLGYTSGRALNSSSSEWMRGQSTDVLPAASMDYRFTRIADMDPAFKFRRANDSTRGQSRFFNDGPNRFCFENLSAPRIAFDVLTDGPDLARYLNGNAAVLLRISGGSNDANLSAYNIANDNSPAFIESTPFSGDGSYYGYRGAIVLRGDVGTRVRVMVDRPQSDVAQHLFVTCLSLGVMSRADLEAQPRPRHTIFETLNISPEYQPTPVPSPTSTPKPGEVTTGETVVPNLGTLKEYTFEEALAAHKGEYFNAKSSNGRAFNLGVRFRWPHSTTGINPSSEEIGRITVVMPPRMDRFRLGVLIDPQNIQPNMGNEPNFDFWMKVPPGSRVKALNDKEGPINCSSSTEVYSGQGTDLAVRMPKVLSAFVLEIGVPVADSSQNVKIGIGPEPAWASNFPWQLREYCAPRVLATVASGRFIFMPIVTNKLGGN